jgi:hypothetical protein
MIGEELGELLAETIFERDDRCRGS